MPTIPRREDELARPRSRKGKDQVPVTKGQSIPVSEIPASGEDWHPIAKHLYESCKTSGQAGYYQASDWAILWSLCDDLSYYKKGVKRSGQMLQTIMSSLERLLVTEGDRRRVRLELESAPDETKPKAQVVAIGQYRARLASPASRTG